MAAFLANVVLIEPVQLVVLGGGAVLGLRLRAGAAATYDAVIAFALSFATYYIFAAGLGIGLRRHLQGIL